MKKEIQHKLNNELAEVFLAKEKHIETLIKGINIVLSEMSEEKRLELIEKLDIKNELTTKLKIANDKIKNIQERMNNLKEEESTKKQELTNQIKDLQSEIIALKSQSSNYRLFSTGSSNYLEYTNSIEAQCSSCGCHGHYDPTVNSMGSVTKCGKCGCYYCYSCMKGKAICDQSNLVFQS